ncbi:MAG: DNA-directed DNA polymerase I [Candidatus Bathyarchaeia archaeon]
MDSDDQVRVAPDNLPTSYLLSADYDGEKEKAFLRLYEPREEKIYLWYDNTGHLPYLITKKTPEEVRQNRRISSHDGFLTCEVVDRFDAINDEEIKVTKVVTRDPLSIGGSRGSIRNYLESWESHIRYYQNYIYDNKLVPGMPYRVEDGNLVAEDYKLPESVRMELDSALEDADPDMREHMMEWARLLQCPVPNIRRVAVDIEVKGERENRLPNPEKATDPIIAVSFASSDGERKIVLLQEVGEPEKTPDLDDTKVVVVEDERELIRETFESLDDYPVVLTFNGDDFDFRFLHNRARNLGYTSSEIPIKLGRRFASLRNGVHIDLYRFFLNRSIQGYAFGEAYREHTLNDVASSLIGMEKLDVGWINDLSMDELARYCMRDGQITLELTTFSDDLVMKLIILLIRISKMIMEDVTRQGVSRWILAMMEYEHRQSGWLIPNTSDIIEAKGGTTTKAVIKGKKYQGAIVREPKPGIHFDVKVLDFASLYPSAIKNWNLSYETLLCEHIECRSNVIPGTPHWVCRVKKGLTSVLIGSLRDLRVLWYKPLSKDEGMDEENRNYYYVVQQALKVFLNASYGVFGAQSFPLYCPPLAESTAAVGRYAMNETVKKSQELGIEVLYGDTDSVFLYQPLQEQTEELIEWANDKLEIDLEVEKTYRYVIFSERKKNYLGVYRDGHMDIKGLTGKKRHVPPFLKDAFDRLTGILSQIESPDEFPEAKMHIRGLVESTHQRLKDLEFDIEEVAFSVQLGKDLDRYDTNPQHVKAAKMLASRGYEIKEGDLISYVVTRNDVRPVQSAHKRDVDISKYEEYMESTFEQLLDALDMNFDAMIGRPQQTSLGTYFRRQK